MDADAATETNAEVIARIAREREPVKLTMDDVLCPYHPRMWDLGAYDAAYLALAEALGCQ